MITIKGKVREGRKVGRTIGYPTINMRYDGDDRGIFAGEVLINGEWRVSAVHLGERPTFADEEVVCEAFLIDWDEDIPVGTDVEVRCDEKIREIQKFKNFEILKNAISNDVEFVKNWYNSRNND